MKRTGWLALAIAATMAVAACSSSGSGGNNGLGDTTPTTTKKDACAGKTLTASEVGVSPSAITVTVVADTGNPLKPGLFQGSVDGVKAWAASVNATGGLACRKVNVLTHDSYLTADEAKNGVTTACTTSVVLLGTTALSLNDMRPVEGCKDKAGAATGIPDLPVLQTEPAEQCSKVSFAVIPNGGSCPYSGKGMRSYQSVTPAVEWFKKNVTTDLHGVFVVPSDLASTITASTPIFTAITRSGVKMDAEFGASAFFTQSQYTPIIQSIKAHKSTWVMNGLDYSGTMAMRKELARTLEPLRKRALVNHPWRDWADEEAHATTRMPGGQSRWSAGKDLSWEPLRIERVCEVKYDHLQGDRFRHATQFIRWRPDKPPADCRYDQLEVTAPYELQKVFSLPDIRRLRDRGR